MILKRLSRSIQTMKHKVQSSTINLKLLLLGLVFVFLLFYVLGSSSSADADKSTSLHDPTGTRSQSSALGCMKLVPSLANTIIHYATSNVTPQQTYKEIAVAARVLQKKSPCNFLVFGLGHDSLMWSALNHGGRTVFLEEDPSWIAVITERFPTLQAHHVKYSTRVSQADELLELGWSKDCTEMAVGEPNSKCPLALKELPSVFYEVEWDLIMVDAPTGYIPEAPGRMGAIYTAGMAARGRSKGETDVFVHDVDRVVEDKFSKTFLCEGYLKEQEGRLRHFTIPSHGAAPEMPFCP